jgi:hypothetical protein
MRVIIAILFFAALVVAGCARTTIPDPHNHVVDVHKQPWDTKIAPDVKLIQVVPPSTAAKRSAVLNPSGTIRAYVVELPWRGDSVRDHIYLDYLTTNETYEVVGVPLPHRPFSDLVWASDRYLVFDRWSQPHYGVHYVVDAVSRRLVLARPFPDQFYLDSQKPKEGNN